MSYTIKNLRDVEDMAVKHGLSDMGESRFARGDLGAEDTGVAYLVLKPGMRQAFAHNHQAAEEVNVVLSGSGRVKIGDEITEIGPLDAIRIAPGVTRAFEAGPEGLEYLVFGTHHEGDAEIVQDFWTE